MKTLAFLRWAWTHENVLAQRIIRSSLWLVAALLAAVLVTYAR